MLDFRTLFAYNVHEKRDGAMRRRYEKQAGAGERTWFAAVIAVQTSGLTIPFFLTEMG